MAERPADDGFVDLVENAELWDGEMDAFYLGRDEVLLLKTGGELRAYAGACPHQSQSLVEGTLEDGVLTCGAHEWQFDALTGASVNPRGECLARHDVRVTDAGMVQVRLRSPLRRSA